MQAAHVLAICTAESLVAAPHSTGMSTFSTKGGLYERAARRFGLADGKRLFSYSFFEKQRLEALVGIPFRCSSFRMLQAIPRVRAISDLPLSTSADIWRMHRCATSSSLPHSILVLGPCRLICVDTLAPAPVPAPAEQVELMGKEMANPAHMSTRQPCLALGCDADQRKRSSPIFAPGSPGTDCSVLLMSHSGLNTMLT